MGCTTSKIVSRRLGAQALAELAPDALVLHVDSSRILWSSACPDLGLREDDLVGPLAGFFPLASLDEIARVGMLTHPRAGGGRRGTARRFVWTLYAGGALVGRNLSLADERESDAAEAARYARVLARSRDKLDAATLPANAVVPVCAMAHLVRLGGAGAQGQGAAHAQHVLTALEAGSRDLHLCQTLCTLQRLVDDVRAWAGERADDDVRFVVDCASPGLLSRELVMDYRRLHTVLTNLLDNAFAFTVAGQVTLRLEERGGAGTAHTTLRVEVRDTGVGVSDEVLREFEGDAGSASRARSFTRVDAASMGVGLPTARKLVRAMGGELRLEKPEAGGSLVSFEVTMAHFRVRRDAAARQASFVMPPHIAAADPAALRACRVLVVHPDEAAAGDLAASLTTMGLREVETAGNCRDCLLRLADDARPAVDVLLVDERVEYGAAPLLELASRIRAPKQAHVMRARDDLRAVAAVFTEYAAA